MPNRIVKSPIVDVNRTYKPVKTNKFSAPWEETKEKVFDRLDEMFLNGPWGSATWIRDTLRSEFDLTRRLATELHVSWVTARHTAS